VAQTAEVLTDRVLRRVRDPAAQSVTRPFVRDLLSHVQRTLNVRHSLVLQTTNLLLQRRRLLYTWPTLLGSSVAAIEGIRWQDLPLARTTFQALTSHDRRWPRRFSDHPRTFATLGELLAVFPGPTHATTFTFVTIKQLPDLVAESDRTEIPDDAIPLLLDLTEALLLLHRRELAPIPSTLLRAQGRAATLGKP